MWKAKESFLVGFCVFLAIFGVWSVSFSHQDNEENASSPTAWHEGYTLILMSNTDIASANQARDYVISRGGRIAILSPPHIMLGWVSTELSAELIGQHGIELVTQDPIDLSIFPYRDEQTLPTASFFNSVSSRSLAKEIAASAAVMGEPLINDALEHPIIDYGAYLKNLEHLAIAPSPGNSDSMTGTVGVALFFVESDGTIDPNLYSWNATDKQNTYDRALSGLSWWASQAPTYGTSVSYVVQKWDAQQAYEPILHPSRDDSLWINPIMSTMGYGSGDKLANVTAFNTYIRNNWNTDWAYTVFIAYNPSPAPTKFTDGYFAYTYLGGPYTQMLFINNGWGEENFGLVLAHETGHIFWACDEYYQAGYGGCTSCGVCSASGPRPTIINGNCEYCNANSVPCMMRANSYALCGYTPQQIGWPSSPPPTGLTVTPADGLISSGNSGGPFSPSSQIYTLQNTGSSSIDWTASKTQTWVSLSSTSGTLAAGASTSVTVSINSNANSLAPGSYSDTVSFTNTTNGNGNATRLVSLTVGTAPTGLTVTPADGLISSGNSGGPFSPSSQIYTLQNTGSSSIDWTPSKTQTWVSLSSISGTLAPMASTTVTVSINSNANSLALGSYSDTVSFTNTTNGNGNTTRPISLTVTGTPSGSITVTYPNGGDNWAPGTTQTIQWTYTGNPGSYVKIELLKGGVLIRTLSSTHSIGTAGSGSCSWSIPSTLTAGSNYQVRVTSTTNGSYTGTSANFTITGPQAPSITVTSPKGGDNWAAGTIQTIQWIYTGNPGSYVKIELLKAGVLNTTISSSYSIGTAGSGSYSWPIPSTLTAGSNYQVRVTSTTNGSYTGTSANFTITGPQAPSITVTSPKGGDNWAAGTIQTIQWIYTGNPGSYVKIELLKAGVLNTTISSSCSIGTAGSGSRSWSILSTQPGGSDYQVRVTSTTNGSYTGTSANFTITGPQAPSITVTSPTGGDNWAAGTIQTIQWIYTGNPGSLVRIELLKGGKLYRTISSSCSIGTAGSGSRSWSILSTQPGGSDYQVRVTSTTNGAYTDASGFFIIIP